jgi:hypothetical protein
VQVDSATGITAYGGTLDEKAQQIACHESPRTSMTGATTP